MVVPVVRGPKITVDELFGPGLPLSHFNSGLLPFFWLKKRMAFSSFMVLKHSFMG